MSDPLWAAMQLSEHPDVWDALTRGLPVPRHRLRPEVLKRIGEATSGGDFVLTERAVLLCEVRQPGDSGEDELPFHVATLDEFVGVDEPGASPLIGDEHGAVVPEGGDFMFYGDGGAGKTTLAVDLACHLAAGDDWLGLPVARAATVLLVENEGPRPLFRAKLRRKRDGWAGSPIGDRVAVLESPWGHVTFADRACRDRFAAVIRECAIDIVIVGPVTRSGMNEAGTLQEVRDFMQLVAQARELSGRRVAFGLVHHENKGGQVSGAWEGAVDTLFHVTGEGHGRTRLYVQKARWSSIHHATTLRLVWTEDDGFEVDKKQELDDEALAELILAEIGQNPGTGCSKMEKAISGVRNDRVRAVRDDLLKAGQIVNVVKRDGLEVAVNHCPERQQARLYPADDPTITHLRPWRGAAGAQAVPDRAAEGRSAPAPCAPPLQGAGRGADVSLLSTNRLPIAADMYRGLLADAGDAGHLMQVERERRGEVAEVAGGRLPHTGAPEFADWIDQKLQDGHLTEAEWLKRRKWHAVVARVA